MEYIFMISDFIHNKLGINPKFLMPLLLTIISLILVRLLKFIVRHILALLEQRKAYIYYRRFNVILSICNIIIIVFIWNDYIGNIITIISFTSAALTLALRELIFNFVAGIYLKIKRPFDVEDRIKVGEVKGDVINISALSFDLLEVGNSINGDQSTGVIVTLPNSKVLTEPIFNYEKNFKYIWQEIVVKTTLDSNVDKVKRYLLEVINSNEVVKRIPKKMEMEMEEISPEYRIYYNKLDPIIYTRVVDSHIEFYIRYLVHPKKTRYVEDDVWNKILMLYRTKKIKLYEV